jgi:pimeloyl-ACP methyl ester carboxylesterase
MKIASLSLRDYTDDLVAFVNWLVSPPLLVGHAQGGLLAQLVAARTRQAGLVAACPAAAAGIFGATPTSLRLCLPHLSRPRPGPSRGAPDVRAISAVDSQRPDRGTRPRVIRRLRLRIGARLLRDLLVSGPGQSYHRQLRRSHHAGACHPGRMRPWRPPTSRPLDSSPVSAGELCGDSTLGPPRLFRGGATRDHGPHRRLDRSESRARHCLAAPADAGRGVSQKNSRAVGQLVARMVRSAAINGRVAGLAQSAGCPPSRRLVSPSALPMDSRPRPIVR